MLKKFKIKIREVSIETFEVDAGNEEEAVDIVTKLDKRNPITSTHSIEWVIDLQAP